MRQGLLLREGMQGLARLFRSRRSFAPLKREVVGSTRLCSSFAYSSALRCVRPRFTPLLMRLEFLNTIYGFWATRLRVWQYWAIF